MSALAGLGIDNIFIDVNNIALPDLDGSAEPFLFLMQSAGLKQQPALKRLIRVKEKVHVASHTGWISVIPHKGLHVSCTLPSATPPHNTQEYSITLSKSSIYAKSLSRARHSTEHLSRKDRRYENKNIQHHVLDTIGDLYMLGYNINGDFKSYNTNLVLNHCLIRKLLTNLNTCEMIETPSHTDNTAKSYY